MKYVLKKDLPFAKAGTEIRFIEKEEYLPALELRNISENNKWVTLLSSKRYWDLYISEGWIEEVKPREIWVEFYKGSNKISDSSFDPTYLRDDARFYTKRFIEVLD